MRTRWMWIGALAVAGMAVAGLSRNGRVLAEHAPAPEAPFQGAHVGAAEAGLPLSPEMPTGASPHGILRATPGLNGQEMYTDAGEGADDVPLNDLELAKVELARQAVAAAEAAGGRAYIDLGDEVPAARLSREEAEKLKLERLDRMHPMRPESVPGLPPSGVSPAVTRSNGSSKGGGR